MVTTTFGSGNHTTYHIELGIFMDSYRYNDKVFKGKRELAINYIMATMGMVQLLFSHQSLGHDIRFSISKIFLMIKQPPSLTSNGEWDTYLGKFCKYQMALGQLNATSQRAPLWDHAILYTGLDIWSKSTKSITGGSRTNSMCDPLYSCSVIESLSSKGYGIYNIIGHELGHSLGMKHDDEWQNSHPECVAKTYIMRATPPSSLYHWSPCSRKSLSQSLPKFRCLLRHQNTPKNVPPPPLLADGSDEPFPKVDLSDRPPPGLSVSLDEQCRLAFGPLSHYIRQQIDGACLDLACYRAPPHFNEADGISDFVQKVAYLGAALEKSYCGTERWCSGGRCSAWDREKDAKINPKSMDGAWSGWFPYTRCEDSCTAPSSPTSAPLIYWARTCSAPSPNFGGRLCSGIETNEQPYEMKVVMCSKIDLNCSAPKPIEKFHNEYCKGLLKLFPYLSGRSLYKAAQCTGHCLTLPSLTLSHKPLKYRVPDGTPCSSSLSDDAETEVSPQKYCFRGSCLNIPTNDLPTSTPLPTTTSVRIPKSLYNGTVLNDTSSVPSTVVITIPSTSIGMSPNAMTPDIRTPSISKCLSRPQDGRYTINKLKVLLGAILVSSVMAAILAIYVRRTEGEVRSHKATFPWAPKYGSFNSYDYDRYSKGGEDPEYESLKALYESLPPMDLPLPEDCIDKGSSPQSKAQRQDNIPSVRPKLMQKLPPKSTRGAKEYDNEQNYCNDQEYASNNTYV